MPRNPGVSNVRTTAFRSISGSVPPTGVPPADEGSASLPGVESIRRLSQRIGPSLEDPFDSVKHVFAALTRQCYDQLRI